MSNSSPFDVGASTWLWDELCDAELPNPGFVVKDLLPQGGRMLVYGDTGTYKSTCILTMAAEIAKGGLWMGKFPCRPGKVCYFSTHDMSLNEWRKERFMPGQEKLTPEVRSRIQLTHFDQVIPIETVAYLSEEDRPRWVQRARDHKPAVVVVDVVAETTRLKANENDTPGRVMTAWSALFDFTPAFIFLHHERKVTLSWNGKVEIAKQAYSGAHEWLAMCSTGLRIESEPTSLNRTMHFVKARNNHEIEGVKLSFNVEDWPFAAVGDKLWTKVWNLLEKFPDEPEKVAKIASGKQTTTENARKKVEEILEVREMQKEFLDGG